MSKSHATKQLLSGPWPEGANRAVSWIKMSKAGKDEGVEFFASIDALEDHIDEMRDDAFNSSDISYAIWVYTWEQRPKCTSHQIIIC